MQRSLPSPRGDGPPERGWQEAVLQPLGKSLTRRIVIRVQDQLLEAVVQAASVEHIALLLERSLEPGTIVHIEMGRESRMFHCSRLLRVLDARPATKERFLVECEFSTPLSREQLLPLVW